MEKFLNNFSTKNKLLLALYLTVFAILFASASYSAYSLTYYSILVWNSLLLIAVLFFGLTILVLIHTILNPNNHEI